MPQGKKGKEKAPAADRPSARLRQRQTRAYDDDLADEDDGDGLLFQHIDNRSSCSTGSDDGTAPAAAAGRGKGRGKGRGRGRAAATAAGRSSGKDTEPQRYKWVDADKHQWVPRGRAAFEPAPV